MKEKVLRDTQIRSMHEMGEMKRAQELRVDEFSVKKIERKSRDNSIAHFAIAGNARVDEFYEWFMEIQEVESNHSGKLSYVPSQPAAIPSSRSVLSCDKRLPLDTWHMSGPQENVFGTLFSTFDSSRNHCQGTHHSTTPGATRSVPGAFLVQGLLSQEMKNELWHNSNADICKKAVDYEFIVACGYAAEFCGLDSEDSKYRNFNSTNSLHFLLFMFEGKIQKPSDYLFWFSIGGCVMDQGRRDGRSIGRI